MYHCAAASLIYTIVLSKQTVMQLIFIASAIEQSELSVK